MDKWYLYEYTYNDNVEDYKIRRYIKEETVTNRWLYRRSFVQVVNEEINHLTASYTNTYEMCLNHLDYILHSCGREDTFTFVNKDLWDLYDKNWNKHKKVFDDSIKFDLIDKLSYTEFKHESFSIDQKHVSRRKNKYIYFLKKNEQIVYVGQTKAINIDKTNRPFSHNDKDFDSFDMIQIDYSMDLDIVEAYYIIKHQPKYNKALPVSKEWYNVIRFALKTSWLPR